MCSPSCSGKLIPILLIFLNLLAPALEIVGVIFSKATDQDSDFKPNQGGSFLDKRGFEILYILTQIAYLLAVYAWVKNKDPSLEDSWMTTWVGAIIATLSFIVTHRDFCIIILRIKLNGFYAPVHIILFLLFLIQIYLLPIVLQLSVVFSIDTYDCNFDLMIRVMVYTLAFTLFLKCVCVVSSFFIQSYLNFITTSASIVIIQNLFWVFLVAYSVISKHRVDGARKGLLSYYEWLMNLCISIHLTFVVNFQFIFEEHEHSSLSQILYILLFICINFGLILVYMVHQVYCCDIYIRKRVRAKMAESIRYCHLDFDAFGKDDLLKPDCDYCSNKLSNPPLEYIEHQDKQNKMYQKLVSYKDAYISFEDVYKYRYRRGRNGQHCSHRFHMACFYNLMKTSNWMVWSCPLCDQRY
ncbi:unnamed protein product [Moneuplotes crassus]|uniref:Uncharacterized protein n=1 Tax=Euplotes crassus TaxID=5936 RepID=A0AAD1X872_EUPCR|nr:unnamed protein product [Moneuplotes crassus]